MAAEVVVLDPFEVADARVELDISSFIDQEGIDWGDAEIQGYAAEAERGSSLVDFRIPNRTVTIPLILKAAGGVPFATIRAQIQAKAALFQREGGWLSRTLSDGASIYYLDIVNATLKLSGGWMQAHRDADIDAVLTLEAIPDFYGEEVTLADHTEATLPHLVFTDTDIGGDYPARVRLVVDEDDGDDQMFLMYGVQSRNYSSAVSAALFYEAEGRTPLGGAAIAAGITGSSGSGSNVVRQGTLTTTYQAMLSTQAVSAGAHLSHVGTFKVWARTHRPATNTGEVSVALEWGEGDFRLRTTNEAVVYEANEREGGYCLTDLGLVSLSKVAQGTQRWEGRVLVKSTVTGDDLDVDCLFLMPVGEGYGEVRGVTLVENPTSFSARDEFDQSAGVLHGKTLPAGGTWDTNDGDATDGSVETSGHTVERTATSDTDIWPAIAGTATFTNVAVQVDFKHTTISSVAQGVLARYADVSNYLVARIYDDPAYPGCLVELSGEVAGAGFILDVVHGVPISVSTFYSMRLLVDAAGRAFVWLWPTGGSPGEPMFAAQDSRLATAGALASGKCGFYDVNGAIPSTRNYDNFLAFVPTPDAAMFASQSCEIRHDRVIREDSAGTIWTPVSQALGDYVRLPPAGLEDRPARIIVKASRNDPDTGTDSGIDNISARAYYRPSWLTVPGS